jgi:hypothetical protein
MDAGITKGGDMPDAYRPGQIAPATGIYLVTHDYRHAWSHEVMVIEGHEFPPCQTCGSEPRFVLIRAAAPVTEHPDFQTAKPA